MESTYHYIFPCPHYRNERITLMDKIRDINENILKQNDEMLERRGIFSDSKLSKLDNTEMSSSSIEYILTTKRFDVPVL